jgi:prepilin-type N-terminal cleavage/methylation domain-containing protein
MRKKCDKKNKRGFSLIELMVAMFIFVILMGAMVAVSIAGFRSYGKSKAIKTVTEDVGFALNSIAKDVRMGKIENGNSYATGNPSDYLLVTRNRGGRVCYKIDSTSISVADLASGIDCSSLIYTNKIVDLSSTGMQFDNPGTAKFRSCITDNKGDGTVTACNGVSNVKRRGWAEINFNISSPSMETDSISVQTVVSSRDYGWEDVP